MLLKALPFAVHLGELERLLAVDAEETLELRFLLFELLLVFLCVGQISRAFCKLGHHLVDLRQNPV